MLVTSHSWFSSKLFVALRVIALEIKEMEKDDYFNFGFSACCIYSRCPFIYRTNLIYGSTCQHCIGSEPSINCDVLTYHIVRNLLSAKQAKMNSNRWYIDMRLYFLVKVILPFWIQRTFENQKYLESLLSFQKCMWECLWVPR